MRVPLFLLNDVISQKTFSVLAFEYSVRRPLRRVNRIGYWVACA
jgi:hypothetical protein